MFWCLDLIFISSRPFSLDHFDDYQKHFTVMNYAEGVELKQVLFFFLLIIVLPASTFSLKSSLWS